jgi:hypothetical protein
MSVTVSLGGAERNRPARSARRRAHERQADAVLPPDWAEVARNSAKEENRSGRLVHFQPKGEQDDSAPKFSRNERARPASHSGNEQQEKMSDSERRFKTIAFFSACDSAKRAEGALLKMHAHEAFERVLQAMDPDQVSASRWESVLGGATMGARKRVSKGVEEFVDDSRRKGPWSLQSLSETQDLLLRGDAQGREATRRFGQFTEAFIAPQATAGEGGSDKTQEEKKHEMENQSRLCEKWALIFGRRLGPSVPALAHLRAPLRIAIESTLDGVSEERGWGEREIDRLFVEAWKAGAVGVAEAQAMGEACAKKVAADPKAWLFVTDANWLAKSACPLTVALCVGGRLGLAEPFGREFWEETLRRATTDSGAAIARLALDNGMRGGAGYFLEKIGTNLADSARAELESELLRDEVAAQGGVQRSGGADVVVCENLPAIRL